MEAREKKEEVENLNETRLLQQNYDESDAAAGHTVEGGDRPPLRVGIVFPRQIFQKRRYQSAIWKSLNEISQLR